MGFNNGQQKAFDEVLKHLMPSTKEITVIFFISDKNGNRSDVVHFVGSDMANLIVAVNKYVDSNPDILSASIG